MIRRVVIACVLWLAIAAGSAAAQTNASPGAHFAQHPSSISVNAIAPACSANYYKNVNGVCVHRPSSSPRGATARCRDRDLQLLKARFRNMLPSRGRFALDPPPVEKKTCFEQLSPK